MELRQLRYAVAVADTLHFGQAAAQQHVAQPSLSRQIRDLEEELGVRLFDRTSRSVQLTSAGEMFTDAARRSLQLADSARRSAEAAARGQAGLVRLGFVTSAASELLPPLLATQRETAPLVELELRELTTTQQVQELRGGHIDLGIARDLPPTPELTITPVLREPMVVAVAFEHPLAGRTSVSLEELSRCQFVTLPPRSAPRMWALASKITLSSGVPLQIAQEARQYATVLALVTANLGVAIIPESVRSFRSTGVHYIRLDEPEAYSEVQVIQRTIEARPSVRRLSELIVRELASEQLPTPVVG